MARITIGAVIFLILVGGLVRMAGAGMGCPDWPKCFGSWVPPTDVSQLPDNYQEIYKDHGYATMEFNVYKTWIEYVNRLIGVLIGFFIILTAWFSWPLRKSARVVTGLSLIALLMVIIQGGIGAYVVRTNLKVGIITVHMVIALALLLVLIAAFLESARLSSTRKQIAVPSPLWGLGIGVLLLTLAQIVMGTQVRESIDKVALAMPGQREAWLSQVDGVYQVHKFFYYLVGAGVAWWIWRLKDFWESIPGLRTLSIAMGGILVLEVLLGIGMHRLGIPAWMQPLHLLLATLLFGIEFSLLYQFKLSLQPTLPWKWEQQPVNS